METKENKPKSGEVKRVFPKSAILVSERFRNQRDIVNALLDDDKNYTLDEVEREINKYMKGQVK